MLQTHPAEPPPHRPAAPARTPESDRHPARLLRRACLLLADLEASYAALRHADEGYEKDMAWQLTAQLLADLESLFNNRLARRWVDRWTFDGCTDLQLPGFVEEQQITAKAAQHAAIALKALDPARPKTDPAPDITRDYALRSIRSADFLVHQLCASCPVEMPPPSVAVETLTSAWRQALETVPC